MDTSPITAWEGAEAYFTFADKPGIMYAILAAAVEVPDGYRSIVLEGSTPGLLGAKAPENPRNLAVVFGQYDEFAGLMWGVPKGGDIEQSKKLQEVFGVSGAVEEGRVYGSIAEGTARLLTNPPIIHPSENFSASGVGDAVDWFQRTLQAPDATPASDQVWLWKEIGTLIAFIGMIGLIDVGEHEMVGQIHATQRQSEILG